MPSRDELIAAAKAKHEREQLLKAAQAKFASEQAPVEQDQGPGALEKAETAARGLFSGATAGVSEPAISGLNAIIQSSLDAIRERDIGELAPEKVKEEYSADVARRKGLQTELPMYDVAGEIGGSVLPVGPAAKLAGMGAKALGGAARVVLPAAKAVKPLVNIAASGAQAAGATLAEEGVKQAVKRATGFQTAEEAPSVMGQAGASAAFGAKLGAGIEGASLLAQGGKKMALGALSALGGVSPEMMKKYLDFARAGGEEISPELAKGKLDDALESIRQKQGGLAQDYSDAVVGSVKRLKDRVNQGSEEAWQILDKTQGKVSVPRDMLLGEVQSVMKDVAGPGGIIGPTTKATMAQLQMLSDDLKGLPDHLDLKTSRDVLRKIRDGIDFNQRAGEYGSVGTNAFKRVQGVLDGMIKERSPEYAQKMAEVAEDTRLLGQASDMFGDSGDVYKKLQSLEQGKDPVQMQALQALGAKTGVDLQKPLQELQQLRTIAALRPGQTQGFLKSLVNDRSIENKKKLAMISQMADQDFSKMVDNLALSTAFDKEFRAGSQHVNFWTVLGGLTAGGLIDNSGFGMGSGAVLGVLTTKFGPRATKELLKQVAAMQGMPTVQKIERLQVPEEMQRYLKMSLVRSIDTFKDYAPVQIPESQKFSMMQDIDSAKGLTPLEKAQAISALSEGQGVAPQILRKMAVAEDKAKPVFTKEGELDEYER